LYGKQDSTDYNLDYTRAENGLKDFECLCLFSIPDIL